MRHKLLAIFLIVGTLQSFAQTRPGSLRGTVTEKATGETIPLANIVIKDESGNIIKGASTNFEGKYNINPVDPGTYTVECSFAGFAKITIEDVLINPNTPTIQDFQMQESSEVLGEVTITYEAPLIDKTKNSKVTTQEDIVNMAVRDITSVTSQAAGVTQDAAGNTNVRGARSEGTVTFIDGVKVRGASNLPQAAISQTEVITGGLPAQYGDAVGGVINVTTRGPSSEYFGSAEVMSSVPFNANDYTLGALTLGGPIAPKWKNKSGKNILGFLFSSEFDYAIDPRNTEIPYRKLDGDYMANLRHTPISLNQAGNGLIFNSELTTAENMNEVFVRPNSFDNQVRLNGSMQIRLSDQTLVSVGGRWVYSNDKRASYGNHIFNYNNNLDQISSDVSGFVKFRQSFKNDPDNESLLTNAFYNIQLDYTRTSDKIFDKEHGDNLFRYGHTGKYEIQRAPSYQFGVSDSGSAYVFNGLQDTAIKYTPADYNRNRTRYMSTYFDIADESANLSTRTLEEIIGQGLPVNGFNPRNVYSGMWGNVGSQQSFRALGVGGANYFKSQDEQFRITASTSFDLKDHSLIVGFEYEQRADRSYAINATNLWIRMRQFQNQPNSELDLDNPILVTDEDGNFQDTINYDFAYSQDDASAFAENVRRELGMDPRSTEQINIDAMDPSTFSLDMFSADELINPNGARGVSYFGYDYTGDLVTSNPDITDFFTATDEDGRFTRPVGAFRPIYIAGYFQDQFTFKDLTFNVGVRVDRFDMNQSVLKDPYILYPNYRVGDLSGTELSGANVPSSIGQDYAVYVSDFELANAEIVGYRSGDQFFNAAGEPISDPALLANAAGGNIKPALKPEFQNVAEQGASTLPAESFEDYTPQTVVMPRVAFNFPISDEALFIAHYDILAQRPGAGQSRLDPFDYLDLINLRNTGVVGNPNLRPQRTIEYELGFKQALSKRTALKISAFYREMRDLLQVVNFPQAFPITYISFGNRDFGTVKGFTLEYEMRRTNNVKIDANYTLQFADGTGSSATTGLNLARVGQAGLRTLQPLNFDVRHQFLFRFDYRYGAGPNYNGPVWFDTRVLENFGINVTANALSGRPYTKRDRAFPITTANPSTITQVEGQINGSRLPWQVTFDARINKVFSLKKKKSLEVYLQVLNVLNTMNVTDVYAFTGSADDDGFLTSQAGQAQIQQQVSEQAYRDLYNVRMNNPFNFSLPRRTRLGIVYNF